jgi:hypothetical protein
MLNVQKTRSLSVLKPEGCKRPWLCWLSFGWCRSNAWHAGRHRQEWIDTPTSPLASAELWWVCHVCAARKQFIVNGSDQIEEFMRWYCAQHPHVTHIVMPDGEVVPVPDFRQLDAGRLN